MPLAKVGESASVNGEVYEDEVGSKYVEVPTNTEAQAQVTSFRRRISDLPDVPQRMNTISVVLSYELFGLSSRDTALATGLSEEQVGRIKMLDAYDEMKEEVVNGIRESDADDVRDIFVKKAKRSAEKLIELSESARPDIALSASKEVLDRGGHTVKQIVEHKHKMDDALRIEIINRDVSEVVPTVDLSQDDYEELERKKDG